MGYKIKRVRIWVNNPYYRNLPSEYQQVDYIESSGTQYIDTGISAPNGFKAIFKVSIVTTVVASQTIIGSHNLNSPYGRNNINVFTNGNTWGLHMNDEMINGLGSITIGQIYDVDGSTILGASYLDVDGVRLTTGNNTSPMSSNNILIFTNQYEVNAHSVFVSAKLYSCMLYNSSYELVRDFIPCYRKSDNVIGMYDLVNNQFYTNSGTGTFNKGSDVLNMVEKQIYPAGWKPGINTLAYRPLTSDLNDYSGNNHNFSATSGTYSFSNNMCTLQRATISGFSLANYSGDFTLSMRTINSSSNCGFMPVVYSDGYQSMRLYWAGDVGFYMKLNNNRYGLAYTSYPGTGIHLITGTKTSTQITLYIDGQEYNHITGTYGQTDSANNTWLGRNVNGSGTITAGDVIIENKARTAEQVADYYNQTKSNYGL